MIGSIIGDIIGSKYEFNNLKCKDFPLFSDGCKYTDDTVMTIAVYKSLKDCDGDYTKLKNILINNMKALGNQYLDIGYGYRFKEWLTKESSEPYYSYGNGSAMRVSGVVEFASSLQETLQLAKITSEVTHNHPEGIKGAIVTAGAIYLAKDRKDKEEIKRFVEKYYSLDFDYRNLVENYQFEVSCQKSVSQAIYGFLISDSYEDCMRTCVSIGGDSDTLCAIAGSIAEYYYGIPEKIKEQGLSYLDDNLRMIINTELISRGNNNV